MRASLDLVEALGAAPDWPARYAAWELALLAELGFGLDLERCAVTGAAEDLAWVSPKTGRAVSRAGGRGLGGAAAAAAGASCARPGRAAGSRRRWRRRWR